MKILVLGVPFAGKTYLSNYMMNRGYNAFDGDYIVGLSKFITRDGKDVTHAVQTGAYKSRRIANRMWQLDFLKGYLDDQPNPIIIFGWAANITDVFSLFDKVFYLGLAQEELAHRFEHNEREHNYGRTASEQLRIKTAHKKWLHTAHHRRNIPIINAVAPPAHIENILKEYCKLGNY